MQTKLETLEEIVTEAAGIDVGDLYSRDRRQRNSDARCAVWFAAYHIFGYSYPFIGRRYNRDHSTIIHGVNKIRGNEAERRLRQLLKERWPGGLRTSKPGAPTIQEWK